MTGTTALRLAQALRAGAATLAAFMAYVAGWNYVACALFITFDVVARSLFGFSSKATFEVTGYMLAGGISWAWPIRWRGGRISASTSG